MDPFGLVSQLSTRADVSAGAFRSITNGITGPLFVPCLLALALAFSIAFLASPHQAAARTMPPLHQSGTSAVPPWSEPSGFPPPRPFGPIMRIAHATETDVDPIDSASEVVQSPAPLPSVRRRSLPDRVARVRRTHLAVVPKVAPRSIDRQPRTDDDHPLGPDRRSTRSHSGSRTRGGDHWIVLPGQTLWSIAAAHLHTNDAARIARYWPRIHRANRDVIGRDPSLIRPGQVFELPPEKP